MRDVYVRQGLTGFHVQGPDHTRYGKEQGGVREMKSRTVAASPENETRSIVMLDYSPSTKAKNWQFQFARNSGTVLREESFGVERFRIRVKRSVPAHCPETGPDDGTFG